MEMAKGKAHGARSSWWRRWGEETFTAYLFLLPAMIILLVTE
jgi:hypothetical protein